MKRYFDQLKQRYIETGFSLKDISRIDKDLAKKNQKRLGDLLTPMNIKQTSRYKESKLNLLKELLDVERGFKELNEKLYHYRELIKYLKAQNTISQQILSKSYAKYMDTEEFSVPFSHYLQEEF